MIIRIIGEGQFDVSGSLFDDLNAIDNKIVDVVQKGDEAGFKIHHAQLIALILAQGKKLPDEELVASSVMVPPADLTLEEARQIFCGDGIFQG